MKECTRSLFLSLGILIACPADVSVQDSGPSIFESFRFSAAYTMGGYPPIPGCYIDVMGVQVFSNGDSFCEYVVKQVKVAEFRRHDAEPDPYEKITLRITPSQARALTKAQSRGLLQWVIAATDSAGPAPLSLNDLVKSHKASPLRRGVGPH
jgi:Flp pilus assembly protein CpaB